MIIKTRKLEGQVALITGATTSAGAIVSKAIAAAGAIVALQYCSERDKAAALLDQIKLKDGEGIFIQADLMFEEQVTEMFCQIIRKYGTVDILIIAHEPSPYGKLHAMQTGEWNKLLGKQLTPQFLCAREALREFLKRGVVENRSVSAGKILFINSTAKAFPERDTTETLVPCSSMLMKSLVHDYRASDIRINCIMVSQISGSTPNEINSVSYSFTDQLTDLGAASVWITSDDCTQANGMTLILNHFLPTER